jgi:hypothetical protein
MDGVEREVEHRETSDGIKENKWTHEGRKDRRYSYINGWKLDYEFNTNELLSERPG